MDSYPEDIASKAEEETEDQAIEEIADEEGNDGRAEEEDTKQGGDIEAEEEQIPVNLHGYWVKCHVKDAHI
jgi:hypothetical protein